VGGKRVTAAAPSAPEVVARGLRFPEGPVSMTDGSVLVVELARGTLSRVTADGCVEVVAACGGAPNGVAIGPDSAAYVCNNGGQDLVVASDGSTRILPVTQGRDYEGGSIQRVDLRTGETSTLYADCDGDPLRAPNDIVFDSAGGFWFTDTGKTRARDRDWGGVYYALPDGSSIRHVIHTLDTPNGVGLSPDGTRLYVSETMSGRVWWWAISSLGELEGHAGDGRHLLAGPGGATYFDSLAVEDEGHVCVATLFRGGITVIAPDGTTELVPLADRLVTNICFGGDDLTTAYVTFSSAGALVKLRWPRAGLRPAFMT
jgi:gluconolactonase